jgi:hypothetical protein
MDEHRQDILSPRHCRRAMSLPVGMGFYLASVTAFRAKPSTPSIRTPRLLASSLDRVLEL